MCAAARPGSSSIRSEQKAAMGERLGCTGDRQRGKQNELALELQTCVARGGQQLVAIEHPAEVLGCVAVLVGALQRDEAGVLAGDGHAREERPVDRRVRELSKKPLPVFFVLE